MTVIEFFDKDHIENVLSSLLCKPERVVYIGDSAKRMNRAIRNYREVLEVRGIRTNLLCRGVSRNNLGKIVEVLDEIVLEDENCLFNLDGGEDLYLVAAGMVAQKHGNRVKLQRFNVRNGTVTGCDADGNCQTRSSIAVSVEENIRIYGGRVLDNTVIPEGTRIWDFDAAFCRNVEAMWELCRKDTANWNRQVGFLDRLNSMFPENDPRHFYGDLNAAREKISRFDSRFRELRDFLEALENKRLIRDLRIGAETVEFDYLDAQVEQCLSKAGLVLELSMAAAALLAREDGEPVYNDVMTGVYIDWDGDLAPQGTADVGNEIDVLLMKGAVPVFISCKNGTVEQEELYKLRNVADRFGGKYAKCVLIANQIDEMGPKGQAIRARAGEMDIRVLDRLDERDLEGCSEAMKNLWKN